MGFSNKIQFDNIDVITTPFEFHGNFEALNRIYVPQSTSKFKELVFYAEENNLTIVLSKHGAFRLFSDINTSDAIIIDLAYLDKIVQYDARNGSFAFEVGLLSKQLQQFLMDNEKFSLLPPSSCVLNQFVRELPVKAMNDDKMMGVERIQLHLKNRECEYRTFIAGFDSLNILYELYPELVDLRHELGGLIRDFVIVNKQYASYFLTYLNDQNITDCLFDAVRKSIQTHQWHLMIEVEASSRIIENIQEIIKGVINKKMSYALNFNRNKFRFKRERVSSNASNDLPKKRQIIINEKIEHDRDLLIEKYYYIYELSQQFNMKPALMFNFSDDGALSINIGNYYGFFENRNIPLQNYLSVLMGRFNLHQDD